MEFTTYLKDVAIYSGYIITIITLGIILIKPIRNAIAKKISGAYTKGKEDQEQYNQLEELMELVQEIKEDLKRGEFLCVQNQDSINELMKALQSSLRNTIMHLYYKYTEEGSDGLPLYEKENIIHLYDAYSNKLNGNSFVKDCYEQLMELPVVRDRQITKNIKETK